MIQGKIHIAGKPVNGIQRCVRCHCNLTGSSKPLLIGTRNHWPKGPVYYNRYGASTRPSKDVQYRDCKGKGLACTNS